MVDLVDVDLKKGDTIHVKRTKNHDKETQDIALVQTAMSDGIQNLTNEFRTKVEKWVSPLEEFGAAFKQAHEKFTTTLKEHEKQIQSDRELLLSALTLVCGKSIGWVGYALQSTVSTASEQLTKSLVDNVIGNLDEAFNWGANQILKSAKAAGMSFELPRVDLNADPESFSRKLRQALMAQLTFVESLLNEQDTQVVTSLNLANEVYHLCGKNLLQAKEYVTKQVSRMKRDWCGAAYYFSNEPNLPTKDVMARIIERSMWAKSLPHLLNARKLVSQPNKATADLFTTHHIENRLVSLGMMQPWNGGFRNRPKGSEIISGEADAKPTLSHPGGFSSGDDMFRLAQQLRAYEIQRIGNLPGIGSSEKRPGKEPSVR